MWTIYIKDSKGDLRLFWYGEVTRREAVAKRYEAGAAAKAQGLTGASVLAFGPCGRIKIGIHGYK